MFFCRIHTEVLFGHVRFNTQTNAESSRQLVDVTSLTQFTSAPLPAAETTAPVSALLRLKTGVTTKALDAMTHHGWTLHDDVVAGCHATEPWVTLNACVNQSVDSRHLGFHGEQTMPV
jgi:hypothetical protein